MCHTRPEEGRKKEARPRQGQKDAYLGQEIVALYPAAAAATFCGGIIGWWVCYLLLGGIMDINAASHTIFSVFAWTTGQTNWSDAFFFPASAASKLPFSYHLGQHLLSHAAYSTCGYA